MHWCRAWIWVLATLLFATPVFANEDNEHPKFRVDGARLIYDTENAPEGVGAEIEVEDADALREILRAHPDISVLELNSGGGSLWASMKMSDIVIDFELDTHVHGDCSSTCARLFVAETTRTMSRGSRIGFHQSWWTADSIQEYYDGNTEEERWDTPFEFASWMYGDTQGEVHKALLYLVRRGVDPLFAIETLKEPSSGMWYPYRIRLLAAGVLTQ
ncbi:MAG: hypothetical protein ABJL99_13485 [Aliishimia sp.]